MADPTEKLAELLGFDPTKKQSLPGDVLKDLLGEIQDERIKEVKTKAKEHLIKAITLREQMEKARRDFDGQYRKFSKELGGILSQLDGLVKGQNSPPSTADSDTTSS